MNLQNFILNHLDYFAMALILGGYFRMGKYKKDGWILSFLGSVCLVIFGTLIVPEALGVALGNAILAIFTARGYILWQKQSL